MGRKGVSKRKPNQKKSKPSLNDKASSGTPVVQAAESQSVKTFDTGKSAPSSTKQKKDSR
jgi:hypothetical protein